MHSAVHNSQAIHINSQRFASYNGRVEEKKNPAAVALGRLGGTNSRKNMSDAKAKQLAQAASEARWGSKKKAVAKKAAKNKTKSKTD